MNEEMLMSSYREFLLELGEFLGLGALAPDDRGFVGLNVDSHVLNMQIIPFTGKLLVFTSVTNVSKGASAAVYKALLSANLFGSDTGGGWFGLEEDSDDIVYHYLIDFAPIRPTVEDFVSALEKIVELSEFWQGHLLDVDSPSLGSSPAGGGAGMIFRP